MNVFAAATSELSKLPAAVRASAAAAVSLLCLSLLLAFLYFPPPPSEPLSLSSTSLSSLDQPLPPPPLTLPPPSPPPPRSVLVQRTGIIDDTGTMVADFEVGHVDQSLAEAFDKTTGKPEEMTIPRIKLERFKVCDDGIKDDYIPCLDNASELEKYERHCPEKGKGLDCLVPRPAGYKVRIPWPKSREEVWFHNVPYDPHLTGDKDDRKSVLVREGKFMFPQSGKDSIPGAAQYWDQISKMVPEMKLGERTRLALDVGCGVASFGVYMLGRNVTTLSIAPKDGRHDDHWIQIALERGVPAMLAGFATRRLLYPSQAFELIHCSQCGVDWTRNDGILLLEADRLLRAGGYFVWAAQKEHHQERWKEMEDLTARVCWKLVKKEGDVAVWQKPIDNSCYLNQENGTKPLLCDAGDDPDDVWYIGLKACLTPLPENGAGSNLSAWPARLHDYPDRLQTINMEASISRKDLFRVETRYWYDIIEGYVQAFRRGDMKLRNVMDMRAGFGGFAVALNDFGIDCWVMNVVPISGFNTLPVIYDRGLIGVMHDWCEPFDTYPRSYDLLHASGLFSAEQKRCNMSTIMLEMDRILRPGGRAYIQDSVTVMDELKDIANATGWVPAIYDTGEGSTASLKILICDKRL